MGWIHGTNWPRISHRPWTSLDRDSGLARHRWCWPAAVRQLRLACGAGLRPSGCQRACGG